MNVNDVDRLRCITDDNEEIFVESFVMEPSANVAMAGYDFEESEDQTVARHLLKVKRIWEGSPEPHLVIPPVRSRNGGLPPYVITAWLNSSGQKIVVVVFVDIHRNKTIEETLQMYLHQINFRVLANIDHEAERRIYDRCNRD